MLSKYGNCWKANIDLSYIFMAREGTLIIEKTLARNGLRRLAGLHFVYKKSENDKEYTEYKEKIRYILCLKNNSETIYRISHRVGMI